MTMRMRQRSHRVGEGDNIWLDGLVWSRPQNEDLLLVCKPIKDPMVLSLHVSDVADTSVRLVEAVKMSGDVLFSRQVKKEITFGL